MDDRLASNYTEEALELDSCIAITITKDEEKIIAFSTILHRDMFGDAVRILNRHYKSPDVRRLSWGHQRRINTYTYEMIKQQVQFAKERDYDVAFISRELKGNNLDNLNFTALNRFKNYFPDKEKWIFSPKMHLVSTPKIFKENWQSILYYKLKKGGRFKTPSISIDAYKERFRKIYSS
ncbi:uncharacterized protein METZ01_LOCUS92530 [marine metagenome]|uniref:N-acetyltransferase domain-containing protein n=1 Tax=marine metagenome TaxID=408172 RepID=A0A381VH25_9ZZZZ